MNQLTALLYAIPDAIERHKRDLEKEAEERAKDSKRHRGKNTKKRPNGLTRDEQQAADRAKWLEEVLQALDANEDPLSSCELGRIMGTTRCSAYRRLLSMEKSGHVVREGTAEKTKWRLG